MARIGWAAALSLLLGGSACSPASTRTSAVVDVNPVPSARVSTRPAEPNGEGRVLLPPMGAADKLVAEGRVYAQRGEYPAALNRFETAYRISPGDELLYDIGRTLELMGRKREAADVYEKSLQGELSHADRMSMELRIKELRASP